MSVRVVAVRDRRTGRVAAYPESVRTDQPGPLTDDERALLDALLSHDFSGVNELRVQAPNILAKKGCACGCGTVNFVPGAGPMPRSEAASPVPVEGVMKDTDGNAVGGLILFVEDGMLWSLEIYSYGGGPLPLPLAEQVTWDAPN